MEDVVRVDRLLDAAELVLLFLIVNVLLPDLLLVHVEVAVRVAHCAMTLRSVVIATEEVEDINGMNHLAIMVCDARVVWYVEHERRRFLCRLIALKTCGNRCDDARGTARDEPACAAGGRGHDGGRAANECCKNGQAKVATHCWTEVGRRSAHKGARARPGETTCHMHMHMQNTVFYWDYDDRFKPSTPVNCTGYTRARGVYANVLQPSYPQVCYRLPRGCDRHEGRRR